jgi:hypothetical protein
LDALFLYLFLLFYPAIEKKDVALKVKAMAALSGAMDEKTALEQLINDYTLAEVIKKKSNINLDSIVEEELKKMSEGNMDSSPIPRLKTVFGEDKQSLKRIFVLPMVVSRLAYTEGYLKDEEFHKPRRQRAEEFLAEVLKKPAAFEDLAGKTGLQYQKGAVSSSKGLVWDQTADTSLLPSGQRVAENWKKAGLYSTPVGKVAPQIIEEDRAWVVLKNLGSSSKEKGAVEIEVASIAREPFSVWVDKQKETISLRRTSKN